jgi:hypothetical protein
MQLRNQGLQSVFFLGLALFVFVGSAMVASGLLIGYLVNYCFPSVGLGSAVLCGTIANGVALWTLGTCTQLVVMTSPINSLLTNDWPPVGVYDESDDADEDDDDDAPLFTEQQMEVLAEHVSAQLMDRIEELSSRRPVAQRKRR